MLVKDRMKRDPVTVTEADDLATAMQLMLWTGTRHLPVVRDGKLVGMLSERDLLRRQESVSGSWKIGGRVSDAMTVGAVITHATESLESAAARMMTEKVGCLPVLEAGRVSGILTTTDLIAEIAACELPQPEPSGQRASQIMTPEPLTAHPGDHLADAAARMVQNGIRHLPVVNGDGEVVGMLSDRDVRTAMGNPMEYVGAEVPASRLGRLAVSDVMTLEPRTVTVDAPLASILSLLVDERLGAVPVLGTNGRLVGIVSYLDVLRLGMGRAKAGASRAASV